MLFIQYFCAMPVYLLSNELVFPDPELSDENGLLAIGGDLSIQRLLLAYSRGIFPWYSSGSPIMWWSPDPRMVLFPDNFKLFKSLRNTLNKKIFNIKTDENFEEVIEHCAKVPRKDQSGTWITSEMIKAYTRLHNKGYCHSVETYYKGELVGGLYGVSLGHAFFGESMFTLKRDASKVALFHLVEKLRSWNFDLIDSQQETRHLKSLGAKAIPRSEFLSMLKKALKHDTIKGKWK